MNVPPEMYAAKEALAEMLEQALPVLPGVVAVDVGLREDGAELTDELVIRIIVTDRENIPPALTPLLAEVSFPVSVVEREFKPLGDGGYYDPIVGGISIAAAHGGAMIQAGHGTLGGIAHDTLFPGSQVGVSCAHVLAASTESVAQGDPIFQPEPGLSGSRQIGRLFRWSDSYDIAVCSIDVTMDYSIGGIGAYSGMGEAKLDDVVHKRGRTTLLTEGKVSGVGLRVLGLESLKNGFEIWSRNADPPVFCDHGDSGSLVIGNANSVVGLLAVSGLPLQRLTTWGVGVPGYLSGFAVQIIPAAASVGIDF